ncbi:MAG: DUF4864 domain-containing protein [Pseudomonadota bacterium]
MHNTIVHFRRLLSSAVMALVLIVALPAAETAADPIDGSAAIVAVIEDQIAAFQRDDLDAAFAHASPLVQGKFGNPARFGMMVQRGYPMIWRPQSYRVGSATETPSGPIQVVTFLDGAGVSWEAAYQMRMIDGTWRIAGVSLKRLPGFST